jgi:hypothetical protein
MVVVQGGCSSLNGLHFTTTSETSFSKYLVTLRDNSARAKALVYYLQQQGFKMTVACISSKSFHTDIESVWNATEAMRVAPQHDAIIFSYLQQHYIGKDHWITKLTGARLYFSFCSLNWPGALANERLQTGQALIADIKTRMISLGSHLTTISLCRHGRTQIQTFHLST